MAWKKAEDVKLPILVSARIWFDLIREDIDNLDQEARCGAALVAGLLIAQGTWYFILRHNSAANVTGFLPMMGCIASSFLLGILTLACIGFMTYLYCEAKEKIDESDAIEEYRRRALEKKKALFEKIDKELLGEDYEL